MVTTYKAHDAAVQFRAAQAAHVGVNGVRIPRHAIAREMQNHTAETPLAAWQAAARSLVVRELMLQEARRLGLAAVPIEDGEGRRETEEEALVRALIEREIATPAPDQATCRRYYERNLSRFCSSDIFEAAHILLAAHPDDAPARSAARTLACGLTAIVQSEPERFATLAAAHSACPSSKAGGNLGQLTAGATTPEFETALRRLSPGEMTAAPVETRYGFHIIRLDRKIEGRPLPLDLVEGRIAEYLAERSRRQAIAQYLARLAAAARVAGVELPTPADLRVN
jgi:peptidyl-prolyl cis-trans isomerase C